MNTRSCHALLLALAAGSVSAQSERSAQRADPFDTLAMILEVNETDGDAEIVMTINVDDGLQWLSLRGPRNRVATELVALDRGGIGLAEVLLESGEPSVEAVLLAYPEGSYRVSAYSVNGRRVEGTVVLSHALLPAPQFTPADGAVVDADAVRVEWAPIAGAEAYRVEIENDDLGTNLTATLRGDATSFAVPAGLLEPGTEYELGVTTISPNGNVAVAEAAFETAD